MQPVRLGRPDLGHQPGQNTRTRQENLPLPQERHRLVEQRTRPLRPGPGPRREERPDILLRPLVGEVPVAVRLANLGRVLPLRGLASGILRHHRGLGNPELASDVVHHDGRDVHRVRKEQPEETHRPELKAEAEPVLITAPTRYQRPVGVIEEEEPLQLRALRWPGEPAVRGYLIIAQELNRHGPQRRTANLLSQTQMS